MKRAAFIAAGIASIIPWLVIVATSEPAYVNIDESIYQQTAKRMTTLGRDAYTAGAVNRPPLVFTVYHAASWLPFEGTLSYHFVGVLFRVVLALCIAALAERCFGESYFAPTFFIAMMGHWVDGQFWSVNSEMLAAPFVAMAVLILFVHERRIDLWQAFVGGLLIGIAGLFKQTCLAMIIVGPAIFFGNAKDQFEEKPPLVRQFAAWFLGALVPIGAAFLWFSRGDSWSDFLFWTMKADAGYVMGSGLPASHWVLHPYRVAKWSLEWFGTGFGYTLVVLLFWVSRKSTYFGGRTAEISEFLRSSINCWMIWGWLIACFIAIAAGHRRSPQYFYHVFPLVTLAVSVCFVESWRRSNSMANDSWVRALSKGLITIFAIVALRQAIATGMSQREYLQGRAAEGRRLRESFDAIVPNGGAVVIWGRLAETQLYGDLHRLPASRYLTADSLKAIWHGKSDKFVVTEEKFIADFMQDVKTTPPAAILDLTASDLLHGSGLQPIDQFEGLKDFLKNFDVKPFEAIHGAKLYVAKAGTSPPAESDPMK